MTRKPAPKWIVEQMCPCDVVVGEIGKDGTVTHEKLDVATRCGTEYDTRTAALKYIKSLGSAAEGKTFRIIRVYETVTPTVETKTVVKF